MKLLIVGATGPTGRELVKQALAQGHEISVLVRNAAPAAFSSPVKMVVGDILDAAFLKAAVPGQADVVRSLG